MAGHRGKAVVDPDRREDRLFVSNSIVTLMNNKSNFRPLLKYAFSFTAVKL